MATQLYRSRSNKRLGGVCAGVAEYFGIDVTLVRLVTLLLVFWGGGFIFYLIAWIILPEESAYHHNGDPMLKSAHSGDKKYLLGWGLVIFASSMIFKRYLPYIPFKQYLWPVLLLFIGYWLITKGKSNNKY
ncbi:PspC domain-containing protein [Clostridium sp. 'deep sea']|uniref:PspC domain-containing protein n=1 Tax=Clostridium sp. 'deep sea' TaxID=2779445 RepID=UPI0018969720|nr:PspC domain-containing protein [Clostridium sp. 'deep sea']QOR34267.1 PspC domain-containing protein [Clostridium sp. 'deep sea']